MCDFLGAKLLAIESSVENEFIKSELTALTVNREYLIRDCAFKKIQLMQLNGFLLSINQDTNSNLFVHEISKMRREEVETCERSTL